MVWNTRDDIKYSLKHNQVGDLIILLFKEICFTCTYISNREIKENRFNSNNQYLFLTNEWSVFLAWQLIKQMK